MKKKTDERRQNLIREENAKGVVVRTRKSRPEENGALSPVWVSCPRGGEALALQVQEKLRTTGARVHEGKEPPREEAPSSVLLCLEDQDVEDQDVEDQDVASAVLHVQALAPHAPVVVFGPTPDPQLAEQALRAGACGFVHAGMPHERIALALSLASEGEVLIPKGLLGELLGRRLFLRRPLLLDP
jgi:hypothetical protein